MLIPAPWPQKPGGHQLESGILCLRYGLWFYDLTSPQTCNYYFTCSSNEHWRLELAKAWLGTFVPWWSLAKSNFQFLLLTLEGILWVQRGHYLLCLLEVTGSHFWRWEVILSKIFNWIMYMYCISGLSVFSHRFYFPSFSSLYIEYKFNDKYIILIFS